MDGGREAGAPSGRTEKASRAPSPTDGFWLRLLAGGFLLAAIIVGGAFALYGLGGGRWSLGDAMYFAVNAVSTAGMRELEGLDHIRFGRVFAGGLILAGLGAVAYFQSSLTALLVRAVFLERFKKRRMQNRIEALKEHVIVAGAGSTGMHVIEELHATHVPFVAIDRDREVLDRIARDVTGGALLYVVGDASDDAVLMQAGVTRAKGVVAALTEDKDNLFVTLSARSLNPSARIVSKVIAPDAAPKMVRAGANATVSPNMIGGRRLAGEVVRPAVVEFVDKMLREHDALRLEEVKVADGSPLSGKTVRDVPSLARANVLVVALRVDKKFLYNPEPSTAVEVGIVLVALGAADDVAKLREVAGASA